MYNQFTETCFTRCVQNLNYRVLTPAEVSLIFPFSFLLQNFKFLFLFDLQAVSKMIVAGFQIVNYREFE